MKYAVAAALAVLGLSGTADAALSKDDMARLQDAVQTCGRLHGTTLGGKPLVERGPFLYDLISLADSLGATDPQRQTLRIDFSSAAERNPRVADGLPAAEIDKLRAAAKDCQTRYAKR